MGVIEIRNLTKTYADGTRAVTNINLSIEAGDIYGIIGLSGAGKSTLIRLLTLLETPDSGEILFEGQNIFKYDKTQLQAYRHKTGMIFQNFNLLSCRTVRGNVAFGLQCAQVPKDQWESRIQEMLKVVGLEDKENTYPAKLSGGQQQRVAIARALGGRPKLLFSDEATSSLDPKTTQSILTLLKSLQKNFGLTIVLITHEMEVIRGICNKVAVLREGEVIEHGDVQEVFRFSKNEYTQELLRNFIIYNA